MNYKQKQFGGINSFSNLDGKAGLATVPDNFVDLVLTDPPYGIADGAKLTKTKGQIVSTQEAWGNDFKDSWDSVEDYYEWALLHKSVEARRRALQLGRLHP